MPSSACPPAPGISTISLHDALPISASRRGLLARSLARKVTGSTPAASASSSSAVSWARALTVAPLARQKLTGSGLWHWKKVARVLGDRKSTRLNSSHTVISYAVFCLSASPRYLHYFPTRRSSDLRQQAGVVGQESRAEGDRIDAGRLGELVERGFAGEGVDRGAVGAPEADRQRALALDEGRAGVGRSEEHTSELQSHSDLVCRLLLVRQPPVSPLFPYTTLFRSPPAGGGCWPGVSRGR